MIQIEEIVSFPKDKNTSINIDKEESEKREEKFLIHIYSCWNPENANDNHAIKMIKTYSNLNQEEIVELINTIIDNRSVLFMVSLKVLDVNNNKSKEITGIYQYNTGTYCLRSLESILDKLLASPSDETKELIYTKSGDCAVMVELGYRRFNNISKDQFEKTWKLMKKCKVMECFEIEHDESNTAALRKQLKPQSSSQQLQLKINKLVVRELAKKWNELVINQIIQRNESARIKQNESVQSTRDLSKPKSEGFVLLCMVVLILLLIGYIFLWLVHYVNPTQDMMRKVPNNDISVELQNTVNPTQDMMRKVPNNDIPVELQNTVNPQAITSN